MSTGPDRFMYGSFDRGSTGPVYLMIRTEKGWSPLSIDEQGYSNPPYFPLDSIDPKKVLVFNFLVQQFPTSNNLFLKTPDNYFLSINSDNIISLVNKVTVDLSFIYPPIGTANPSDWLIQPPVSSDSYDLANSIPIVAGVGYNIWMGQTTWTLPLYKTKTDSQIESSSNGKNQSSNYQQTKYPIHIIPQKAIIGPGCGTQTSDTLDILLTGDYSLLYYTNISACKTQSVGNPTYGECGGKDFGVCSSTSIVCNPYGQSITKCTEADSDNAKDDGLTVTIITCIVFGLLLIFAFYTLFLKK